MRGVASHGEGVVRDAQERGMSVRFRIDGLHPGVFDPYVLWHLLDGDISKESVEIIVEIW